MSYYIDIIDQVLNENLFVIEFASKSGITLSWSGSDKKDDLSIVGSNLEFDLAHTENVDAKFIKFFTGNEVRFRVELRNQYDDSLIWTGFLIPDTYSEPYTHEAVFVKITASCGLGRLKGKYLPGDYYDAEKSVVDIICKILSLTSLNLNVFFNPAIENSIQKDWNAIYIDTASFVEKNKKKDAYKILDILMSDMLCVCFQANNRWNIEGLNQRHVRGYNAKVYDVNGNLLGLDEGLKLLKKITPLVTPDVTMIPPYNLITVNHNRIPQNFPKTIAQEKNDGWSVMAGVVGEIYSTDWNGNADFYSQAIFPDYFNSIKKEYYVPPFPYGQIPVVTPFDETKFINLKNKIFVYKHQKVTITAAFKIIKYDKVMSGIVADAYINPLLYQITLNDVVVFSNRKETIPINEALIFEDGEAELVFDWIVPTEGLLDVKLWRPAGPIYKTNILGFEIKKLEINPVNFEELSIVTDVISGEFTIDKDMDLIYADDDTAFSSAFRLAKLKEATISYNVISIPILYAFSQMGKFYSVVNLNGANLIKDNINTTFYNNSILKNLEVIYNYNSSEQMVIRTDFAIMSGAFSVRVFKTDDYLESRVSWLQWTDSVYKIESNRYLQTVANINRRMFSEASEKLDVVALNAIKFNDLILFNYVNEKKFVVCNCSWNLDENKTTLTLVRGIYRDSGDTGPNPENIPPIVNAGVDIILGNSETSTSLLAVAYDTDGYIVSQNWTKITGGFGDVITDPFSLATTLQNLTDDLYEYQIQVTDNDGATAIDTIRLIRHKKYAISLPNIYASGSDGSVLIDYKYKFQINPNIDPSFNLLLKGKCILFGYVDYAYARFRIKKNGVQVFEFLLGVGNAAEDSIFSIGYISTDEIIFELDQEGNFPDIHFGSSWIELNAIDFVNGSGEITGLPIKVQPIPNPFIP